MQVSLPRLRRTLHAAAALLALAAPASAQRNRPNIVFLFSDDHAAHAISAYRPHLRYGARLPDTPRLDELAASGMLFADAFVTNSICGPSRATVLTGQYGHLNGVMTNLVEMHPATVTFPALLRDAGYETALFGKWHLRSAPAGFDHYEVLAGQGPYYNPTLLGPSDTVAYTGYTPDIVTTRALGWLRERAADTRDGDARGERPFLLMLHFNAPHRYWDPGPEQLGLFRDSVIEEPATLFDDGARRASGFVRQEMTLALDLFERDLKLTPPNNLTSAQLEQWHAMYDAENEAFLAADADDVEALRWRYQRYIGDYMRSALAVDANVGRVLDFLRDAGLDENTVVVYTSDQGFFLGDHGFFDKRWMYEESIRTPLLVRWPGVVAAGSVNRDLVMNLDLAQTLLELGGAPAPASMQGESLVPLLRGRTPADWRDAIYYQYF
ncbi:MAG TPA: sulfatase-like hydrolase/transferase, partial [Longimicrobiales bacterium]